MVIFPHFIMTLDTCMTLPIPASSPINSIPRGSCLLPWKRTCGIIAGLRLSITAYWWYRMSFTTWIPTNSPNILFQYSLFSIMIRNDQYRKSQHPSKWWEFFALPYFGVSQSTSVFEGFLPPTVVMEFVVAAQGRECAQADWVGEEDLGSSVNPYLQRNHQLKCWQQNTKQTKWKNPASTSLPVELDLRWHITQNLNRETKIIQTRHSLRPKPAMRWDTEQITSRRCSQENIYIKQLWAR